VTRRDGSRLSIWWRDKRDYFALVAAINAKVFVDGKDAVLRMQLAHPDEAEVGQVRFAIAIAFGQGSQLGQVVVAIEGEPDQIFFNHFEYDSGIAEVKSGLSQDRLAREKWLADLRGNV
jgi:hypothetical protein